MKRGWWVLALMASLELGLIVSQPQWARSVLRTQYVWLFRSANWLTGQDLPTPARFR